MQTSSESMGGVTDAYQNFRIQSYQLEKSSASSWFGLKSAWERSCVANLQRCFQPETIHTGASINHQTWFLGLSLNKFVSSNKAPAWSSVLANSRRDSNEERPWYPFCSASADPINESKNSPCKSPRAPDKRVSASAFLPMVESVAYEAACNRDQPTCLFYQNSHVTRLGYQACGQTRSRQHRNRNRIMEMFCKVPGNAQGKIAILSAKCGTCKALPPLSLSSHEGKAWIMESWRKWFWHLNLLSFLERNLGTIVCRHCSLMFIQRTVFESR